jgi:DNA-binding response OmpR family regulator
VTVQPAGRPNNPKILVVDDTEEIRTLVVTILEDEGYTIQTAADGQEGLRLFYAWQPTLVLLDLMMPKMDGWTLLERIREVSQTPVVILTARGQEHEKVRGLRGGADDYLVKPFGQLELLARVETVLRRSKPVAMEPEDIYQDSALYVDFRRHRVLFHNREVDLSATEFRLLSALVRNAEMVMSADRLLDLSWPEGAGAPENLRVYIGYLRRKLRDDSEGQPLIETVREFGYRYRAPGRRS